MTSTLVEAPADVIEFTAWADERGWGDGLPAIPPTQERVEKMLEGTTRDRHDLVGEVPPRAGQASVEVIATNAVMAGCQPEHLPVIIAAVEALLEPELNLQGLQPTTNPAGPMLVINGPVRDRLGIASGVNALSGGNPANLRIGRAVQFVLRNVGGAVVPTDQSVIGSPWKRGIVLAEAEAASPWSPLHVRLEFAPEDDVVTVFNLESMINVPAPYRDPDAILQMMAMAMCNGLNLHYSGGILMACFNPHHAGRLAAAGLTADDVRAELFRRARVPVSFYPTEGNASQAEWVREGNEVLMTNDVSRVQVMVAGSDWPAHSMCFNGWAISGLASRVISADG